MIVHSIVRVAQISLKKRKWYFQDDWSSVCFVQFWNGQK